MADVDPRIAELAKKSANFGYLLQHEPLLVSYGVAAEIHVHDDPNTAMVKARQFGEVLAQHLVARLNIPVPAKQPSLAQRIDALRKNGVLVDEIKQRFDWIRQIGNQAVHSHYAVVRDALRAVETCFVLGDWLHRSDTNDQTVRGFLPPAQSGSQPQPVSPEDQRELDTLRSELTEYRRQLIDAKLRFDDGMSRLDAERAALVEAEAALHRAATDQGRLRSLADELSGEVERLRQILDDARPAKVSAVERDRFVSGAQRAGTNRPLNEAQVRVRIDEALTAAGWIVQDSAESNIMAGTGVAVREVDTAVGRADYFLYVERMLVGVLEAKRQGADLTAAQRQADRYAAGLKPEQELTAFRTPLPFIYVSDGNEVRLRNGLDPEPRTRRVFAVHQPQTLARWIRAAKDNPDRPTLRARLRDLPNTALDTASLRPAQVRAVAGLERSLARDDERSLIQMATGAGKTYAAAAATYRLFHHAGARRVLFLVDRNNLGDQARGEFVNYTTPDDGRKLGEIYNVARLASAGMVESSHVVISTIQRLWMLLTGRAESINPDDDSAELDSDDMIDGPVEVGYNAAIPPEAFDLIIVDECHRSIYGKWRAVLEYFDAHLVGLTATPVAQTMGFFYGNLVSQYTFEEAVADGVNVDFDVYRIRTELGERGATIDAGTVVPVRNRRTRQQWLHELEQDFQYSQTQLGRTAISQDQLRLVLETFRDRLFTEIFPGREEVPKTLIFAVDDNHAEEIVATARRVFGRGDDFCAKITHKEARRNELLSRLRNSPTLRIAVTVDLIATGTDVRPLECVFFMRDVKSWSYFEQMKGRGARTIDPVEFQQVTPDAATKDRFVLVDAAGVTDSDRVDARPLQRHTEKQLSLEKLLARTGTLSVGEDEIATLASRLARLNADMKDDERDELARIAGTPLADIVAGLVKAADPDERDAAEKAGGPEAVRTLEEDALAPLASNPALRERILEIRRAKDIVYDEVNPDRLIEATGVSREELALRTVTSFHDYLEEHRAEIAVFETAFREHRNPHELYRELEALAARIARPPHQWTPDSLLDAYATLGKTAGKRRGAGVVDLIGILRYELGVDEAVRPYRSIVEERYAAWLARQEQAGAQFTDEQQWWLGRIVDVVSTSARIEIDDLSHVPFTERGGPDGFLQTFGDDRAEALITELNQDLTA